MICPECGKELKREFIYVGSAKIYREVCNDCPLVVYPRTNFTKLCNALSKERRRIKKDIKKFSK